MKLRHFTLNELLIAMALLIILATVLLKIFGAASTFWTASNEQSQLYGDAKIALSVLTDDLENMINRLPDADGNLQVVIPFTATFDTTGLETAKLPSALPDYYKSGESLAAPYLLFVTRTLDPMDNANSSWEQVRPSLVSWCFIPPQIGIDANGRKILMENTGVLRRCVVPFDANADNFDKRLIPTQSNIFTEQLDHTYAVNYQNVIDGVLNVQFRVYSGDNRQPNALYAGSSNASGSNTTSTHATATQGMTEVDSIQVVLTMMSQANMLKLETLDADEDRIEFIRQHSRTLTKTITLGGEFK